MRFARWCQRESAVTGNDAGDTVIARGTEHRVPEDLRVVMRMHVDEAGRDDASRRVEYDVAAQIDTHLGDDVTGHPHIGDLWMCTAAIDYEPTAHHEIFHRAIVGQRQSVSFARCRASGDDIPKRR